MASFQNQNMKHADKKKSVTYKNSEVSLALIILPPFAVDNSNAQ